MNVPLLDLKAQYKTIRDEVRKAMDEVCDAQAFILGPRVESLEKKVADYCGAGAAVGMSSGTDALLVALMALDIGPGDAVLTTPYSFFATAGSIARVGATPVFADIDPVTFNLDSESLRRTLERMPDRFRALKPKALIPVHLYGQCAEMDALLATARDYGLKVIEDAAQAIGAEYPGEKGSRRAGAMGDMGCFSFFPSKNLGGFGDGGMVTTNDPGLADKLRWLRNHGCRKKYYHDFVGGNFRLDALQAAVLEVKLGHLEKWHAARRANADRYHGHFKKSPVIPPKAIYRDAGIRNFHVFNQYVVRVPERDRALERLKAANIGCEVYYPVPLHLQACFRHLGYREGDLPESERAARETLALPIYPELTAEMQEQVATTLLEGL